MKAASRFSWKGEIRRLGVSGGVAALVCLIWAVARAQVAVGEWVQRYNGPANRDDQGYAIAVDTSGDVVVAGTSDPNFDYVTIKYSSLGLPLWTNRCTGSGASQFFPPTVAVDADANVFLAGASWNGSNADCVTIHYSSAGESLWTNRFAGRDHDVAVAVAVDHHNDLIVAGHSNPNLLTLKYSNVGVALWTNLYNGPGVSSGASAVAVDSSNNVLVTGGSFAAGSGGLSDWITLKYSSGGVPLWTNRYSSPGNQDDSAYGMAVDASGNAFVVGYAVSDHLMIKYSPDGVPLWTNKIAPGVITMDGSDSIVMAGESAAGNCVTVKYSNAGLPLWTNFYNGPGSSSDASAVAVDGGGNIYVTGSSARTNTSPNYNFDWATIAYSSAGVPLWTNRYSSSGSGDDYPSDIAADATGNVFVTGSYWNGANYDWATIKYSVFQPFLLMTRPTADQLVLSWTNAAFGLQSAPAVNGPFTNLTGATSPCTNSISSAQEFFRLIAN